MVFAIMLPSVSYAIDSFNSAQDTVLAKQISEKISEEASMFYYLGNGSKKELEFFSQNKIVIHSEGTKIIISSAQKSFESETFFNQNISETQFQQKFFLIVEKKENQTVVSATSK
jgi:virulence-associated protein VagC